MHIDYEAKSENDIAEIVDSSVANEVMQRCGITQVLKVQNQTHVFIMHACTNEWSHCVHMTTKEVIGQEVMFFDAIDCVAKLLDQLCDGLRSLGVLHIMRAFPDLFLPLFTYTASVTSSDVQESVFVDEERTVVDIVVMEYLRQFI